MTVSRPSFTMPRNRGLQWDSGATWVLRLALPAPSRPSATGAAAKSSDGDSARRRHRDLLTERDAVEQGPRRPVAGHVPVASRDLAERDDDVLAQVVHVHVDPRQIPVDLLRQVRIAAEADDSVPVLPVNPQVV